MKERLRDARDFDTTSLSEKAHGQNLHRDYSAHFFRWSFARRFIKSTDSVLEVGCGPERPLYRILATNRLQLMRYYCGVDLNPLPAWHVRNADFVGNFNFCEQYQQLTPRVDKPGKRGSAGFNVAVCMEVIEHMKPEHGRKLLKGLHYWLKPGGALLLSTPVYDGKRHAANHIHEYEAPELQREIERAGFKVERRFGTFMDTRHIGRRAKSDGLPADTPWAEEEVADAIRIVSTLLGDYFDRDALSNFFAPLYPNEARNNLWVCRKP